MHLFYLSEITGNSIALDTVESRHCIKVLRLKKDDIVHLTNGRGSLFEAKISVADPSGCLLTIVKETREYQKRNYKIHIAIAPTKSIDKLEWFIEKATEIGVDEITPVICDFSERTTLKNDRLDKIIISALKQSCQVYKPKLNLAIPLSKFLNEPFLGQCFIAHCAEGEKYHLKEIYVPGSDCLILIGPEGDFSPDEINLAKSKNFKEITLSNNRLRTETAGVIACHTIVLLNS